MVINTALELGATLVGFLKIWNPESKELADSKKFIERAKRLGMVINGNSAVVSAQRTMIRPMVGIEQSIIHSEYGSDLMTIIQLRDISAVLSHLEMKGTAGGVSISSLVDEVNPKRSGLAGFQGLESFGGTNVLGGVSGLEARIERDNEDDGRVLIDGKSYAEIREYAPLALGRTVRASTYLDGNKVEFPLSFRQIPMVLPQKELENVFEAAKIEDGLLARIDMHTAGLITTPELLTGKDIINDKFRIRMRDIQGMYEEAVKRDRGNKRAALATGVVSMNTLANTYIMTDATATKIERQIGKRFSSPSGREDIWKRVYANTIVIVNEGRGLFTFYTMGEAVPETYTRAELKTKAGKESSVGSLNDILKLLNGG